jgi:hypothetical protein
MPNTRENEEFRNRPFVKYEDETFARRPVEMKDTSRLFIDEDICDLSWPLNRASVAFKTIRVAGSGFLKATSELSN